MDTVEPGGIEIGGADDVELTGQTVVYKAIVCVVTELRGQSVTLEGHAVIV